jgi:hypothetical protein
MANVSDVYTIYANTGQLDEATRKVAQFQSQVEKVGSGGGGKGAMALNALAQGFEDMQYSVGGAMNNMSNAVSLMGGGAGLVAVTTLAGVAINQLVRHWDEIIPVLGNTTPILAAANALESLSESAGKSETLATGMAAGWEGALGAATGLTSDILELATGWGAAKDAAKDHADQAERAAKFTKEAAAAADRLGKIQSTAQKEQGEKGQLIGKALAEMGGAGGIGRVIKNLAETEVGLGENQDVTIGGVTKKQREWAEQNLTLLFDRATKGDQEAIDQVRQKLQGQGFDMTGFNAAMQGRDIAKENEELNKQGIENERKMHEETLKEQEREDKELAALEDKEWFEEVSKAEKSGKALAKETEEARTREEKLPSALLDVPEAELRLGRARMNLAEKLFGGPADRIGATDFARTAEGKGADLGRQQLEVEQAILEVDRETLNVLKAQNNVAVLSK